MINILAIAASLITGPLQARALGAEGRGDLATVLAVLAVGIPSLSLALGGYAAVALARGRRAGELMGSLGAVLLVIGLVGAAFAPALSSYLAGDRETVRTLLLVAFLLMPLTLPATILMSMLGSAERWRELYLARLITLVLPLGGVVVLYVFDRLTVASATWLVIGSGALSLIPQMAALRGGGPWRFRLSIAREGVAFGLKLWLGGLLLLVNARFDQLVMIKLTSNRELGLYAIAVSVASLSQVATGAVGPPLLARVARGETDIVHRATRTVVGLTAVLAAAGCLIVPWALPIVFGREFEEAIDMAMVLLVGAICLSGTAVLASALQAAGAPGLVSMAEGCGVALTLGGLIALLPTLGGLGAAVTSLVAYAATFGVLLALARRRFGGTTASYVVPRREDATWIRHRLIGLVRRRAARSRRL